MIRSMFHGACVAMQPRVWDVRVRSVGSEGVGIRVCGTEGVGIRVWGGGHFVVRYDMLCSATEWYAYIGPVTFSKRSASFQTCNFSNSASLVCIRRSIVCVSEIGSRVCQQGELLCQCLHDMASWRRRRCMPSSGCINRMATIGPFRTGRNEDSYMPSLSVESRASQSLNGAPLARRSQIMGRWQIILCG